MLCPYLIIIAETKYAEAFSRTICGYFRCRIDDFCTYFLHGDDVLLFWISCSTFRSLIIGVPTYRFVRTCSNSKWMKLLLYFFLNEERKWINQKIRSSGVFLWGHVFMVEVEAHPRVWSYFINFWLTAFKWISRNIFAQLNLKITIATKQDLLSVKEENLKLKQNFQKSKK